MSDYSPNPVPSGTVSGAKNLGAFQARETISAHSKSHLIIHDRPCRLFSTSFKNQSGGTLYYMLFDAVTLPGNGTHPSGIAAEVAAGGVSFFDYPTGRPFKNGCIVAASSTDDTLTLAGDTSDFEANFA